MGARAALFGAILLRKLRAMSDPFIGERRGHHCDETAAC